MLDRNLPYNMSYSILAKKSNELTEGEIEQYSSLFKTVFQKGKKPDTLRKQFQANPLGYCHHALMIHHSEGLVGAFSAAPTRYRAKGESMLFGLSLDTMIHPAHRSDPLHFKRMAERCYELLRADGIPFIFGFPNEYSRTYFQRVLKWRPMGELDYFILPVRPGHCLGCLQILDKPFRFLLKTYLKIAAILGSSSEIHCPIEPVGTDSLEGLLYLEGRQLAALRGGGSCCFGIHKEDLGLRVAYIVDVLPRRRQFIFRAAEAILDTNLDVDVITYVGRLPLTPIFLLRIPHSQIPHRLFMLGFPLKEEFLPTTIFDINQWWLNLSSFDVR